MSFGQRPFHEALPTAGRPGGHPLSAGVRAHMETRFGFDFGDVRVHAGPEATAQAAAADALAYTVGTDIVLSDDRAGRGTPDDSALLAHELGHVLQNKQLGPVPMVLREERPKGPRAAAPTACERRGPEPVSGEMLLFRVDTTEPIPGQEGPIQDVLKSAEEASGIEIHGYASIEGPSPEYNYDLACRRATVTSGWLQGMGISVPIRAFSHGPTEAFGPAASNRSVVIVITPPACLPMSKAFANEWALARPYWDKAGNLAKRYTSLLAFSWHPDTDPEAPISNLYWFAELYEIITGEELLAARQGKFEHPSFVLHFIPIFYDMYYDSLQAFEKGDLSKVSPLWQRHFKTATESSAGDLSAITASVETGVEAHIKGDMSEALVRAFQSYVKKYCLAGASLDDYKKDFFETNKKVFEGVQREFLLRLAAKGPFPGPVDINAPVIGTGQRITGIGLSVDTVYEWRRKAWESALSKLAAAPATP